MPEAGAQLLGAGGPSGHAAHDGALLQPGAPSVPSCAVFPCTSVPQAEVHAKSLCVRAYACVWSVCLYARISGMQVCAAADISDRRVSI